MLRHVSRKLVDHSIEALVGQIEGEFSFSSLHRALSSRSVRAPGTWASTGPVSFEPDPAIRIPLPMRRNPSASVANRNPSTGNPSPRAPPCVMTGCPVISPSSPWHWLEPSRWRSHRALLDGCPLPATIRRGRDTARLDSTSLMVRRRRLGGDLRRRCQEPEDQQCSDHQRSCGNHGRCQRSRVGRRWSSSVRAEQGSPRIRVIQASEDLHEGGVDEELTAPVDGEGQLIG